jgi:hypothetical protein
MEAEDWLKGIEKKLMIAQCMNHEKVLFAVHQLFGMIANWWETFYNTTQTSTLLHGMSSRLVSVPTTCNVA